MWLHSEEMQSTHHPSVKYWRISSREPATMGVAMLVPRMLSWMHVGSLPCLPHCRIKLNCSYEQNLY